VRYVTGLLIALGVFWFAMSGMTEPLILVFGGISVVLSLALALRLNVIDGESSPYFRFHAFLAYWAWLIVEIAKANWRVIRACLKADLDINPALVRVKTVCRSNLAKTTFANSITLTPGTVTVEIEGDRMLVHALYEEDAEPSAFSRIDRRVARAVDGART
jgi:multicomponent Na+:H+ antiporter subunit E